MEPWFDPSLKFKCTGCGKCCTGTDGYVFLSPKDIEKLATHLSISTEQFIKQYTRIVEDKPALLDRGKSGECMFLKDNKCSVYEARPIQCSTFPWWIHTIRSPEAWAEAAESCEGINHPDAPEVPASHILNECQTYLDNLIEENFTS